MKGPSGVWGFVHQEIIGLIKKVVVPVPCSLHGSLHSVRSCLGMTLNNYSQKTGCQQRKEGWA